MPLTPGSSRAVISHNIDELTHHGSRPRPHKQIVAIALHNADKYRARGGKLFKAPITPGFSPSPTVLAHGLVQGGGNGRSDSLHFKVPKGGYVIPADVVSGVGAGNTGAGARVLEHTFPAHLASIQGRPHIRGETPLMHSPFNVAFPQRKIARGGNTGHDDGMTHVLLSEGEFFVNPRVLAAKYGSLSHAHKVMDHWVQARRKATIKTMKNLKAPVGAKKI